MSTYLDLVNKVINESASELDELTSGTWSSAEAGRRIYPRIKRNVADAWKTIQMEDNMWEFKTAQLSTIVYPRVKYNTGSRSTGTPGVGVQFQGADSGFILTVRSTTVASGTWAAGTAVGQIEFGTYSGNGQVTPGEVFEEVGAGTGTFVYLGLGNYDFSVTQTDISEIQWPTFTANQEGSTAAPVSYIPYDNWEYQNLSFTASTTSTPAYVSQDHEGNVLFYPQALTPFRVNFVYTVTPQILSAYTDTPTRLPSAYHDWIAWEALMSFALFDKNPDLFAYARKNATFYRQRAQHNLSPLISWRASSFNKVGC